MCARRVTKGGKWVMLTKTHNEQDEQGGQDL